MPDFTVARRGTDSSGRPIYATAFYWQVRAAVLRRPRVRPFAHLVTTVQGAFMERVPGGGAAASAGFHNKAGAEDVRTWNLSAEQERILWWEFALFAIIFWPRGPAAFMGGMDEHGHGCAGWDRPLSPGIAGQWAQAKNRRDGLASNGPDYVKPRPPWVDFPPAELLQEDYMATDDAVRKLNQALEGIADLRKDVEKLASAEQRRNLAEIRRHKAARKRTYALLGSLADRLGVIVDATADTATKAQVKGVKDEILRALAEDADVDGPDNPAPDKVPTP